MNRRLPLRDTFVCFAIYAVGFTALAEFLPWFAFLPTAATVALAHLYLEQRRRERRFREVVGDLKGPPVESSEETHSADRPVDELIFDSLSDMAAELEKKSYQLVEKNIQLLSLKEISLSVISSLDELRIVDSVHSFLSRGLAFKEILVGIVNQESTALHVYTFREAFGDTSKQEKEVSLDDLGGLLRKSVFSRQPILIRDPDMHPVGDLNGQPVFRDSTMDSYLIVPMIKSKYSQHCSKAPNCILKNQAVGALEVHSADEARCAACDGLPVLGVIGVTDGFKAASLSQVDLVAVETLALQISTLLENSQLYHELQNEESFRENIINSMMNGLITVNKQGTILLANEATESMSQYTSQQLKGMSSNRLIVDKTQASAEGPLLRTLRERKNTVQSEAWIVCRDGQRRPIMLNTSLLLDENREVQGALGVFIDITRIKRMEEQIQHLDKLAALGRFSSSMAHEIRNPLTGIVAGLQYLRRVGGIPDSQTENITFILKEVNRIDRLISDILSVVRRGNLVYHPVQIESIINSGIASVKGFAAERNVSIDTIFPANTKTVMVDSDRITQVIINLLKNAVEASDEGGEVIVKVSFPPDRDDVLFDEVRNLGVIEVVDHGVGFSEEEKRKIFEPFFTTKTDGTGLGLYVAHGIVEQHGGYLFVDSEKGRGSTFTIYLPLEKIEHGSSSQVSHPVGG